MTALPEGVLVGWYGDDFTGSSATLEVLAFAGLPSVLFFDIPSDEQLARFEGMRGIGIASTARSQDPAWMDRHLPAAFDWLHALGAPINHYKVCSTFDSAPGIGSIGRAIDIASPRFDGGWVPLMLAAPAMRRYQCFGHFFASAPGGIFRLDRHPVMAHHPVTPMNEADVRLHLARQTRKPIDLINIEALEADPVTALCAKIDHGAEILALDTLNEGHLATVGQLIWEQRAGQLFAAGSQGVEYALIAYWRKKGLIGRPRPLKGISPAERMMAISGSVSPTTAMQIAQAEADGFAKIQFDVTSVLRDDDKAEDNAFEAAMAAIEDGRDVLVYSACGPDDPAVANLHDSVKSAGLREDDANARIGAALGRILNRILRSAGIRRAAIAGGDTSGHACRQLGIFALTALAPTIPGAALFTAHSDDPIMDGLELALKGGQMGSVNYFAQIKNGVG